MGKIGAETVRGKIRSLAIDPVEPATMYIGTEPAGLLISDDEGRTWRGATGVCEIAQNRKWTYPVPAIEPHVRWIALAPKTKRILLAAQVGGIVYSNDAGASWRDLRDPIDIDVHSIVIDPFDTQRSMPLPAAVSVRPIQRANRSTAATMAASHGRPSPTRWSGTTPCR